MHENMIFYVCMYKCYKYDVTLLQKKSKMIFSRKNTFKGDWHFRLTFMKEFQWFSILLWRPSLAFLNIAFQWKKPGYLKYRIYRSFRSSCVIKIVLSKHVNLIMQIINVITNMEDIRQERPNKSPILKLNRRLK